MNLGGAGWPWDPKQPLEGKASPGYHTYIVVKRKKKADCISRDRKTVAVPQDLPL